MIRGSRDSLLCVANYRPDVGFAWWLMENFWVELAELGRRRGLEPLLVYPAEGPIPERIREAGFEVLTQAFPGNSLGALMASLELVRSHRVRCIYFTDRGFSNLAYLTLRLAGVRIIVNHDHTPGDRPSVGGLKGAAKAAWRRFRPAACDLQICVSPMIRDRAIHNARIPADRVAVVQNGIAPIECSGDRHYAHRALGLAQDLQICMTVGRAHPYKRVDFVIEVARRCVFDLGCERLAFVHCGDGPDLERLSDLVHRAGLDGRFILAGRRADVQDLLCSADIAMHAAMGEAFSLAIVEYMSAALAVLVPDIPTVRQAIRHQETGLVYPDGDADSAARLLADLVKQPHRRTMLGAAAAEEVRRCYSLTTMNQQFRDVLDPLLGRA